MDTTALERFGLNEKEIKVYLCLLQAGELTGGCVATKTHIHRRTAYDTLEALKEKGLLSFSVKERIRYFKAVKPQALLDILKQREDSIKSILPKLEELQKQSVKNADAQVFQGKKSIKKILDEVLRTPRYVALGAGEPYREMLGPYFLLFQKQKQQLGIKSRILVAEKYMNEDVAVKTFGEVKFIAGYEAPTTTLVYGNKAAIIIPEPALGIVIESEKVAASFKNYFELMWGAATA